MSYPLKVRNSLRAFCAADCKNTTVVRHENGAQLFFALWAHVVPLRH
jgi:hypothetical protein